jgi:TatD DNase family protein
MKLDYIDIHSHLNLSPLFENQGEVLAKMREMNIGTITVGTEMETSKMAIDIAEKNPDICWATVGFHPLSIDDVFSPPVKGEVGGGFKTNNPTSVLPLSGEEEQLWNELEQLARHEKVVAIGETGLDYFRDQSLEIKVQQTEIFKRHITLAQKVGKPLMLHVRASRGTDDAYYDALQILQEMNYQGKADFHFFSGSVQCMRDIIDAGYIISVDGPITFVTEYDDMIRACPIDKLMIETDAPYAAPAPYRGKTCEPWMVVEVVKKIAELKGLDLETVREQMIKNTKEFFGV